MAEDKDDDLGQEIVLDDQTDAPADDLSEQQVAEAADRVESGEDDLDDYSRNVQKRIKKLTEKYREAERQGQEATTFAQQVLEENKKLRERMEKLDSGYLTEYGARIEAQIGTARKAYKDAYEAGDTDAMIEAQEALARATGEKDRYDMAKRRADQQREARPAQENLAQYAQMPTQQPQPQHAQPDPKAQSWAEKNEWFGQDEVMTYAAFGIHRKLVEEEGFDPTSDEYYTEIDRRMRVEFPQKFAAKKSSTKSQVASAGSSASRTNKQGRRSVKLSPSQIAIAKKLNVPLEEYAKYVKE
jgi:hypothetical protein